MKTKTILCAILCILSLVSIKAQSFAVWDNETLTLDNGFIKRVIKFNAASHTIISNSMKLKSDPEEFLNKVSEEFYFEIDKKPFTGLSNWNLISIENVTGDNYGKGAVVVVEQPNLQIRVKITYLLYPGLPLIRKKIAFQNTGEQEIKLESLDIEYLRFAGSNTGTHCWVMRDYARQKSLGQFTGEWYDPVVVVHEVDRKRGIVLGNEAPGVMKRTTAFLKYDLLTTGLTHSEQNFGFRKWIKPGESWESTWVFTGIYRDSDDPYTALNGFVNDYVRKYLGTRLSQIPDKPVFVYNTWIPFRHNINEKLIYELADAAAECGIEEFVIDDGWQTSYGDWGIDPKKFPKGFKPVFDYIKSKGMKPGVWISLAAAESVSNVYKQHPEWVVRKADGSPINLHSDSEKMYQWESYSMCMTSGWYDYIKGIILNLTKEHGLEYIKGDFAAVTGAYTSDKTRSGCYATDHLMHKDRNESMLAMYQRTWQLFDDLHKEAPKLFIDCTFETMGALQLIDLDMCKHAEGNWLSNFEQAAPLGSLRVRQMSWWRTPVIPATALVIGNQRFDDPNFELSLMSLAGSLPIVLGDPRLLNKEQRARMKTWGEWLRNMQDKYDFMSFRQDLPGYGEPSEGLWDGFQRINSDTGTGGIVGIFRQGSAEDKRIVTVKYLNPDYKYVIKKAPEGIIILTATGKELEKKGFAVKFEKDFDGALFEVSRAK
jgi:alpha-galactosidase